MTLTIGRASLPDQADVIIDGDDVTFRVLLGASSVTQMKALRQQVAGIANNPDEEVVPVTSTLDSTLDGFYRVKSVSIPSHAVTYVSGFVPPVTISLQRIGGGYGNPTFEVVGSTVTRTNAHGLTGTAYVHVPGTGTSVTYDVSSLGGLASSDTRPTADGVSMRVEARAITGTTGTYRFEVAAADFYKAGCKIEVEYGGVWYPAVGLQIPRSTRFRIGNELVRFTSGNGSTEATFEVWNGSAWSSQNVSFYDVSGNVKRIGRNAPGTVGWSPDIDLPVTVLRNSPECVTIRQSSWSDQITFSLRRGDLHMSIHWSTASSFTGNTRFGLAMTSGVAGTARSGGVQQTALVSGVALFLVTAEANTGYVDTGNTRVRQQNATTKATMFIGALIGASPTTLGTYTAIGQEMMGGVNWRQRVVPR